MGKVYVLFFPPIIHKRGVFMAEGKGKPSTRAKNKYNAANYERIALVVPKGAKAVIKEHAENHGESINGFVNRAINETMKNDDSAAD